jgi:hypothetical protein
MTGLAAALMAAPAAAQDFWKHWGDGNAELNGYRLEQPRYGSVRSGTAVMIFVTEDFDDAARVKNEGRGEPQGEVFPVLKLNHVRDFQTGIYDYNVMTSVFLRVRRGWPVRKVSFSSQEWCGHVWDQLLPRDGGVQQTWHSYFQAEADGQRRLELPEGAVFGDAVPLLVRDWTGEWVKPGESREVPWLPTLLEARFAHLPVAWGRATVSRSASPREVKVPAGTFSVEEWRVAVAGGGTTTWLVEAEAPWRIVGWSGGDGEKGELLGTTRLPYWQLNGPEGEAKLKELGLR